MDEKRAFEYSIPYHNQKADIHSSFYYYVIYTASLLIFLIMNLVGVPMLTCLAFVFGLTAVWWLAFSLPLLKNCEQTCGKPYEKGDVARRCV